MNLIKDLGIIYTSKTKKYKHRFGIFECPLCKSHFKTQTTHINQGNIKSCGCIKKINNGMRTHGLANKTRLYSTWKSMRQRCYNKNNIGYKNYGGRGITVCDEWDDFSKFNNWALSNNYNKNLSIDRINNDGNYEPTNCRWATSQEQADNKRELIITNSTGINGLTFHRRDKLWQARLTYNNERICFGHFKDKNLAINILDEARSFYATI